MGTIIGAENFPNYGDCPAKGKLDGLKRLIRPCLHESEYIATRPASSLIAAGLEAFRKCHNSPEWDANSIMSRLSSGHRIGVICAALFDLACNAEYIHGRMVNRNWIYCRRENSVPRAYYSFLKQCPQCCQDKGLERRLSGAQHKPSSHHIGEITTTITSLFCFLWCQAAERPLQVGIVSKQNHDADMVAWRNDLLVLLEVKASPLVTYPVRVTLESPYTKDGADGVEELPQHSLVDIDYRDKELSLYLANTNTDVPLGVPSQQGENWPYIPLRNFIASPEGLMDYVKAWGEIYLAYSIPKTQRSGRNTILGYLANGWGDEIDSNKTKAGLGRTDDIKKGTYQLLKFGAHYRAGSPMLPIRGALVSNLDPLFLFPEYLEKLIAARWADASQYSPSPETPETLSIQEDDLFYLYDSILTFNRPIVNDPLLKGCFKLSDFESMVIGGKFDNILAQWRNNDEQG